jgi:hypothetical protein
MLTLHGGFVLAGDKGPGSVKREGFFCSLEGVVD